MKQIIISGYNGFIGSVLTPKFEKFEIYGISNNKNKIIKNVIPIIKSINKIKSSDFKKSVQTIIHLGAISDVTYCNKHPENCYETNVIGTNRLLEIARKDDANFIFASTSHVYGNPKKLPIKENDKTDPLSIYSSSKILAERMCETYSKLYGLNITVLRLFSVYGPNSPKHNIIRNIINQIRTKPQVTLGNVNSKRDFIHIDDVTNAFFKVSKSQKKGFNTYNICTNKSTSIKEICEKLIKQNKIGIPIISDKKKLRENDAPEIRGSFLKFKKQYDWTPKINLEYGLKTTFYKQDKI